MEKSCKKCASKASPRPLFNLVNNPKQSLYARNSFKRNSFNFERGLSKSFKKFNFIFSFEPLLMDKL